MHSATGGLITGHVFGVRCGGFIILCGKDWRGLGSEIRD